MRFVLMCECGSENFKYDENKGFTCKSCNNTYPEEEAGKNLIGEGR